MSERPLSDQAARDLIVSRLDLNLLVEAGAGSGKTHSLARRMVAGIVSGRYRVGEMAAVTFTRKAAAELRGRFQAELEIRLRKESDEQAKARIGEALSGLEHLFAGTIHSFCAHLLRERPVEAGLAPGFSEVDELEDAEIRRGAWRDYLARERARDSALLRELSDAGVKPADLDDAFGKVCTFEEVEFPPGTSAMPEADPVWAALDRFWGRLRKRLPNPIPEETTCPVQQKARECRWRMRAAKRERTPDLVALLRLWESKLEVVQCRWHPDPVQKRKIGEEINQLVKAFQAETVQPFLAAWRHYVYRVAMTLLVEARGFAREARYRSLRLNYNDLLQGAARLLGEHPDVRRVLQWKYRWLFVDEFQDTDPIQADVILLLASDDLASAPSGPQGSLPTKQQPGSLPNIQYPLSTTASDLRLRPGSLFIVGDPKQSIFRFRRADIEIYNHVRAIIERSGGQVVRLITTFRAASELCDWANGAFKNIFPRAATSQQAEFQELIPDQPKAGAGVRVLTTSVDGSAEQVAIADAAAIARYIRSETEAGHRKPGDFLVLTWKKKQLSQYATALEAQEVPIEVTGAGAFGNSAEVGALAVLLGALGDPDDGVSVVAVLRGPLFGLSDEELFLHRRSGGWFTIPSRPEPSSVVAQDLSPASTSLTPAGHPSVLAALRTLSEMRQLTRTLPLPAAVERILESTGCLALAATRVPGGAEAGDLLHAVDRVREVMEGGGTLADAATALQETIDTGEVEAWPLEPGRTDVVRVMNLHKAKGLEAPVVFLADPCGGFESEAEIRIDRQGAKAIGYMQIVAKDPDRPWVRPVLGEPTDWAAHSAREQPFLDAEADRLRYVAATRAKDLLVISRWAKRTGKQPWAAFEPGLLGVPELVVPRKIAARPAGKVDLAEKTRIRLAAERAGRLHSAKEESFTVQSVTGLTHREAVVREDDPARLLRGPATGMAWGDLIHKLLEYAMRQRQPTRADLERLADWLTFENAELRAVVPEALDTVERVLQSDVWKDARAATDCHVEVPFVVPSHDGDGRRVLLSGVIDLVYRTGEGWRIVDYKTDQLPAPGEPDLMTRYSAQLDSYAGGWANLTGETCTVAGLSSVRDGKTTWRTRSSG